MQTNNFLPNTLGGEGGGVTSPTNTKRGFVIASVTICITPPSGESSPNGEKLKMLILLLILILVFGFGGYRMGPGLGYYGGGGISLILLIVLILLLLKVI
jgi:hypothetical protein